MMMTDMDEKKINKNNRVVRRSTVVVVRHGERLDYVQRAAGKNWCQANPEQQPWNPPLTKNGLGMATQLGAALEGKILPELGLPPIGAVYTSPFLRCRQTAAGIIQGASSSVDCENSDADKKNLKVRVELGLSESMNENWYRSWSLPGTDGTWGYKKQEMPHIDPIRDKMDPRALQPVETHLDWKECSTVDTHGILDGMMDHDHQSRTSLGGDYSFADNPPKLESFRTQRDRMANAMNLLSNEHCRRTTAGTDDDQIYRDNNDEDETTIVLVSHGGPVTHLYESLTGNDWNEHGEGRYCCFSIYRNQEEISPDVENDGIKWNPLVVNRVLWDDDTDSNKDPATTTGSNR